MIAVPDREPVSISPKMIMVHNDVMVGQIIRRICNFLSIAITKESRTGQFWFGKHNTFDFHTKDQILDSPLIVVSLLKQFVVIIKESYFKNVKEHFGDHKPYHFNEPLRL